MPTQLVDAATARALAFVIALDDVSYHPHQAELEAYVDHPSRPRGGGLPKGMQAMLRTFSAAASSMDWDFSPQKSMTEHLISLMWVDFDGPSLGLAPTELGRAVWRAIDRESVERPEMLHLLLDAEDPFAIFRAVRSVADIGPAILVDPYFGLEQLAVVYEHTGIDRVLTSDKGRSTKKAHPILQSALKQLTGRRLEIRVAAKDIHDRHVIGDNGKVLGFGASLNGIGGRSPTFLIDFGSAGDGIARTYRRLWNDATPLGVALPPDS